MALSEDLLKVIEKSALDEGSLNSVRDKLRACAGTPPWDIVTNLLGLLVSSSTAFNLPIGGSIVARKLFIMLQNIQDGSLEIEEFRPLIDVVVNSSRTDTDIWAAVIDLIEAVRPSTPQNFTAATPTFFGTPVKTSSSRLADSETREIVEKELFHEVKRCTFRNVKGFWDKFFDSESWDEERKAMLKGMMAEHDGRKWTGFPSTPDEKPVWEWLRSLEKRFLAGVPYELCTTNNANQFEERKGQLDIFLRRPPKREDSIFSYKDVLVVGEQKKSAVTRNFKATLLQLTRYVRSIFADQPTRRFVHAFSLCGSTMELWVFDRSGPYSSGQFDIHGEPKKFARAFVGYATMDDDAMGLDTFIERNGTHRYVTLDDAENNETRIGLERIIIRQKAIVCRGTTCYMTQNRNVAKFSWVPDKRKPEVDQLNLAKERGVKGVAKVVAYRRITTIGEMRRGLEFQKSHRFREEIDLFEDLSATASTNTPGQKRKSSSDNTFDNVSGSKRQRSNRPKPGPVEELNDQLSISKPKPSLCTLSEDLWENRIYSCLVVSPAGRVISDFKSVKELLESMRDAIKAHQSLYMTGEILHRDISSNNIIITKPETAEGFKGMLIDLDLAKVKYSGPSGARQQTGTMQFMAVEVLRGIDHTYRHDLESFFYVLLWMCARQSWMNGFAANGEEMPKRSVLRRWEIGDFQDIADAKEGSMTVNGVDRIVSEFPRLLNVVRPLCLDIRKILFPLDKDERMFFGTHKGDPDRLYRPIIEAYDKVILDLGKNSSEVI